MKNYILILSISLAFFACRNNNKSDESNLEGSSNDLSEYVFKVSGLNDTIIADSIWKMIFTVEGIDQLHIKTNDSTIIIKADKTMVEPEALAKEITSRGGTILK